MFDELDTLEHVLSLDDEDVRDMQDIEDQTYGANSTLLEANAVHSATIAALKGLKRAYWEALREKHDLSVRDNYRLQQQENGKWALYRKVQSEFTAPDMDELGGGTYWGLSKPELDD